MRASDLIGMTVQGRGGENVGELEEIVVDTGGQQVHYAVVAFDSGWLQAEKRVALPLRSLVGADAGRLVLDVDRAQANAMRPFDAQRYANLNDRTFVVDIDRYLATLPPADGRQAAGAANERTSGVDAGTRASGAGPARGGDSGVPSPSQDRN